MPHAVLIYSHFKFSQHPQLVHHLCAFRKLLMCAFLLFPQASDYLTTALAFFSHVQ